MTLPRLLVLTDRRQAEARGRTLLGTVTAALDAGAPAIVLREKDLPADERRALAAAVAGAVRERGGQLIVAGDVGLATVVGADGVHLAAHDPPARASPVLVGRSCHAGEEVRAAAAERADYLTLSPVAATASKPGYGPPLGRERFADLVAAADGTPVFALGGVTADDVPTWRAAGAHGIAVMGGVMGATDPATAVRDLLDRLAEETP